MRLSFGYRNLTAIPPEAILSTAKKVTWLDLTGNRLSDLDDLLNFRNMKGLVLDDNSLDSHVRLPPLPNLTTLWVNSNNIDNVVTFITMLKANVPNLTDLSLLKNAACPNYLTEGSPKDYLDYRLYVISQLPKLQVLDTSPVTSEERTAAVAKYR
eukprot:TRINITY_DN13327_c0_g1_i1.p1 TRINITY_DN13327_c0_g1~~TRINITY_DN13327_c0_g1_i1.p1  ORF type:complete len:155 (+),score=21.83 TRINITY_DN13327_c0_g1_i1:96-560(+)